MPTSSPTFSRRVSARRRPRPSTAGWLSEPQSSTTARKQWMPTIWSTRCSAPDGDSGYAPHDRGRCHALEETMTLLIGASVLWLALHFILAGTRLRDKV